MDTLVIDIETKNSFADVGGQQFLTALEASFVGVYSYAQDKYFSFFERDFAELGKMLQKSGLIIGFSSIRFDIPVMRKYFESGNKFSTGTNFNIFALKQFDILDEIETKLGFRISLDILAKQNLGIGKTHHGLEAIQFYKDQNWKELESYCLHDVKITKDLYDLAKARGYLLVPQKYSPELIKAEFKIRDVFMPASLF